MTDLNEKRALITNWERDEFYRCSDEKGYKKWLKEHPDMIELVGGNHQVKPYFDIDSYEPIDTDDIILKLNEMFPDKPVYVCAREPREKKGKMKYSEHYCVGDVRISWKLIPQLLINNKYEKNKPFDFNVYKDKAVFHTPYTTEKKGGSVVPPLIPRDCSIFDCCASYISKDYENWDDKVKIPEPDIMPKKILYDDVNDNDENTETNLNFDELITKYSKQRATDYETWQPMGFALINLYHRKIISKGKLQDLFDTFSSKADNYNDEGVSKFLKINTKRLDGKGYGIKYMLEQLKIDNLAYYKFLKFKDMTISGANDDIGASKIVVDYYKEDFVSCKGIFYVKHNDIWIDNPVEVDKILINKIGDLDIKFYGADGKRKYSYSSSVKHIKDCIMCIKANISIVNDKFYDDMIKNQLYYLPFLDGIYSFIDSKLYKYKELPDIHFTFKINRMFPTYNKVDYDELMNRVIIPIYPNEEERIHNAHIKARALAGCYHDKIWYGYGGSRNSGKGVESGLTKSAFEEFVSSFDSKCLILNKHNDEPAKALAWTVDKKFARLIISNEIEDNNNKNKLNGNLIKTLASGGDPIEARKLYQNSITFIPQFTMILCYNSLCEIVPNDATENLEQFEYKSKFVSQEELIPNVPFLKLKDDTIKQLIKEPRIIDAYTLYILKHFNNIRMPTPKSIKISTEVNKIDEPITKEQFVINNFITTNNIDDKIHTTTITEILNDNGYNISQIDTGRLINRIGLGKHNKHTEINKVRKNGYEYIKYNNTNYEV